jgi:hypothetical protein
MTVTAFLPTGPRQPIEMLDGNAALRLVVVDRYSADALRSDWDAPGVYLLLDPIASDGRYGVYVGKAPAGLRNRLRQHVKSKGHWARALLIMRDTTHGWHSAQVGWLEGRLYDLLDAAPLATLSNGNRPQDETLPRYERSTLETATKAIAGALRLLGCSPDPTTEKSDVGVLKRQSSGRQLLHRGFSPPGLSRDHRPGPKRITG